MLFVSDETGGFDLARPGFDPSLWVTVVVPPGTATLLRAQLVHWCEKWTLDGLHAVQLDDERRRTIAATIAVSDLIWTATGIDQHLMTPQEAEQWRCEQADELRSTFAASEARGTTDQRYAGRGDELHRMVANPRRLPLAPFVQYGIVAPRHYADSVNAALRRYGDPSYAAGWRTRRLLAHHKGPGRQRGPVFMRELMYPILATLPLTLPIGLQQAGHPLAALRTGMQISTFFEGDPVFVDSHTEPLIQIPDLIGWIVRRRVTHPHEDVTAKTFRLLRQRAAEVDGFRVRWMYRRGRRPDDRRYRCLLD